MPFPINFSTLAELYWCW